MGDRREINREIFEDTELQCKKHPVLAKVVKEAIQKQKIYLETESVVSLKEKKHGRTEIVVSAKRSFEAAKAYRDKKVCVHNFASATNPGGGVTRGSSAQEECLCRCSTLYFNLVAQACWDKFYAPHRAMHYPVYNDDCIYTPDVVVFKSDTDYPIVLPESEWYKVNVLTCAAPNLRAIPSNSMNPNAGKKPVKMKNSELLELHLKRNRRILDVAAANGNEVVILGAFGCGAFQNPPEVVAESYKQLVKEYDGVFETIEFAVYCPEHDRRNYEVFCRILGEA